MMPRRYGPLPMSRSTMQRASDGGFIASEGTSVSLTGSRVAWSTRSIFRARLVARER